MTAAASPAPLAAGFILFDSSLNPIWFNSDGVEILNYPDKPGNPWRLNGFLADKLRNFMLNGHTSENGLFTAELTSGKRRYLCRAFLLKSRGKGSSQRAIALLLERNSAGWNGVSHIAERFNLTPREREAVELLLQGLTNKEIANRMDISPNTVKAHIRLIMIKMGVSTRSGLLGKIIAPGP